MSTSNPLHFLSQTTKKSTAAMNVVAVMLSNMRKYPGLFALINDAMMTPKRSQIEEPLAMITSRPMANSDVDRCMDILREAGCV